MFLKASWYVAARSAEVTRQPLGRLLLDEPVERGDHPVQPGDADVVQPVHGIAHDRRRNPRFLGDGEVRGAGRGDEDRSTPLGRRSLIQRDAARELVVARGGKRCTYAVKRFTGGPGDQQAVPRVDDPLGDGGDLGGGLSLPENHLRKALAGVAVVIHAGEAQILERLLA